MFKKRSSGTQAANVALLYVLIGVGYVLLASWAAPRWFGAPEGFRPGEFVRGLVFVMLSGLLIFWLTRRFFREISWNELMLVRMLASIPEAVFVVSWPKRAIIYANGACERVFGYEPEQLVGESTAMLYPDDERFQKIGRAATAEMEENEIARRRARMRRRDGSIFPADISGTLFVGEDGAHYVVSVVRDVTREMEAEKQRRYYEQRLRGILEAIPVPLAMVRLDDDRVVYLNDSVKQTFGVDDTDMNRSLKSREFFADADSHDRIMGQIAGDEVIETMELRAISHDGEEMWIAATGRMLEYDGERVAMIAFLDVTSLHQTREMLAHAQKMEAVGQLTDGIAHDFNNLLTMILLNCDAMIDEAQTAEDLRSCAENMREAGVKAADLVDKLLDFSSAAAGTPKVLDLNAVIQDQYPFLRRTLGSHIEIAVMLDDIPVLASIDQTAFENALLNLAANARDAMPEGGTLTIRTEHAIVEEGATGLQGALRPGNYVSVTVEDTGEGIPADIIDKVFEPFFTTKQMGKGTGLGLSTVYGFAKNSDGHVEIESDVGKGTCIALFLPKAHGEPETVRPAPLKSALPKGQEAILLVEDDRQIRQFVTRQLESLGYSVQDFSDSDNALNTLKSGGAGFDLLLSDVVMPGSLNGYDLAREAVSLCPDICILLMTGYAPQQHLGDGTASTSFDILAKPFTKRELATRVRNVLDDRPVPEPRKHSASSQR